MDKKVKENLRKAILKRQNLKNRIRQASNIVNSSYPYYISNEIIEHSKNNSNIKSQNSENESSDARWIKNNKGASEKTLQAIRKKLGIVEGKGVLEDNKSQQRIDLTALSSHMSIKNCQIQSSDLSNTSTFNSYITNIDSEKRNLYLKEARIKSYRNTIHINKKSKKPCDAQTLSNLDDKIFSSGKRKFRVEIPKISINQEYVTNSNLKLYLFNLHKFKSASRRECIQGQNVIFNPENNPYQNFEEPYNQPKENLHLLTNIKHSHATNIQPKQSNEQGNEIQGENLPTQKLKFSIDRIVKPNPQKKSNQVSVIKYISSKINPEVFKEKIKPPLQIGENFKSEEVTKKDQKSAHTCHLTIDIKSLACGRKKSCLPDRFKTKTGMISYSRFLKNIPRISRLSKMDVRGERSYPSTITGVKRYKSVFMREITPKSITQIHKFPRIVYGISNKFKKSKTYHKNDKIKNTSRHISQKSQVLDYPQKRTK